MSKRAQVKRKPGRPKKWLIYTDSCTGCFEGGDYMGLAHNYRYDTKAGCHVGMGCHECGYTGKRRHVLSLEAMAKDMNMTVDELNAIDLED